MFICSANGQPYDDYSDGIWDDGEWTSWDSINEHLYKQELLEGFHEDADPDVVQVFDDLVESAHAYKNLTGRYLQTWGELGELYAELKYGITRHGPMTQGSDGVLDDALVEIKTRSPEKKSNTVQVKRAGNFTRLCVVHINEKFEFSSHWIERNMAAEGTGKLVKFHCVPPPAQ